MFDFIKTMLGGSTSNLTPEMLQNGTIVDVRSPQEFNEGHVTGSINIPLQDIDRSLAKFRKLPAPIITCCASGNRSGMAMSQLQAAGIEAINGGSWGSVQRQLQE